ncbi:MAG: Slp family lipoprotein [Desulfuromonadales bacterium]|nr:Slp family lipoprotein [Desulfuromonadales bacterium]
MRSSIRPQLFVICLMLAILLMPGCTHVIPSAARAKADRNLDFTAIKNNPDQYLGQTLLLGGLVVDIELAREGTTLEIFSYGLDFTGEPVYTDANSGRFLSRTDRFLDPALFAPGRFVTLVATVQGRKTKPLGEIDYTYPVLSIDNIYLWETPYRYALPPNSGFLAPVPFDRRDYLRHNPYDPDLYYPYSPFWWRTPPGY